MSERIIPLVDQRIGPLPLPRHDKHTQTSGTLTDTLMRPLNDLRISVTDRCNFRCSYCMPKEVFGKDHPYLSHSELLSFEEITRLTRVFLSHGVRKVRLTGGEPLLRKNLETLVEQLAGLRTIDGQTPELTLTTNGSLLARKARTLRDAGLARVTVSLDALDDTIFKRMNDVDFPVGEVLDGIAAAQDAGLGSIKVNMVVKRGVNDDQVLPMARHFRGSGIVLRFIEFMDVGATNQWRMDEVVPSATILQTIGQEFPLISLTREQAGETAQRWGYAGADGRHDPALGEIGVVSSVTQAFCRDCNRARLSMEGKLFLCLFASQGYDLREFLRSGADDAELSATLAAIWRQRSDRYSELRSSLPEADRNSRRRVEMSYIGG